MQRSNKSLIVWSAIAAAVVLMGTLFFIPNEAPNEPTQPTPSVAVPAPPPN